MKTVRLSFAAALAALGLQACDVSVQPQASTSASTQQAQQPAAPVDATPAPVQSTPAPASTPVAAGDSSAAAPAPAAPETAAMGAQPAAQAVPDGVAAPTELAQFFEQNAIQPKAQ